MTRALTFIEATAAVIFGGAALVFAYLGYSLAQANEERLDRQETQTYAARVYVGEAPREVYDELDVPDGELLYLVFNTSGIQVENVWVQGTDDRRLNIYGVQRCTMYALPLGFAATDLYFTDPLNQWHRDRSGVLDNTFVPPQPGDTDDSGWWDTIDNCSG